MLGGIVSGGINLIQKATSGISSYFSSSSSSSSKSSSYSSASSYANANATMGTKDVVGPAENPTSATKPQYWKPAAGEEAREATAIIKGENGEEKIIPTYQKDGAMYDRETGEIISSNHGVEGAYGDPEEYTKTYYTEKEGYVGPVGVWVPKEKETSSRPSSPSPTPSYTPPPRKPPFQSIGPAPTFEMDIKQVSRYTYYSGIDSLQIKNVQTNPEVCFISKSVNVGALEKEEYIQLDAKYYAGENASIEFYIVDGSREIPIVPIGDKTIQNEKIFYNMPTRFPIDTTHAVSVKQGSKKTNLSFDSAYKKATEDNIESAYNISYTPTSSYKYKPINTTIKIKTILRSYDILDYAPYISTMKIRKYGGNALWNQVI